MGILWTVIAALIVLWLVGLVMHLFGPVIHLLLVIAAVLFVISMFSGRTTSV